MRIREIGYDRWQHFFDDFTQLHHGEHVNVETMGQAGLGVKEELCDLPLVGIVDAGPKAGSGECVEVVAESPQERQSTHWVAHPSRVVIAEDHGHAVALQIESADGSVTIVRFVPPRDGMPPGFKVA